MPMWMIEGLPEYMTLGAHDTHTAIWMRDRVAMEDIPTIKELSKKPNEYFPYRYGHALWSYLTGKWGDKSIETLQVLTVKNGLDSAFNDLFGIKPDSVSVLWADALKETYSPYMEDTIGAVGREFLDESGKSNLIHSPVISSDGKYITFISDRNVISIDVYLANLQTGEIISRLTRAVRKTYIDDYSYLESAGSFSPDSKKYAITTFSSGRNKLLIINLGAFLTRDTIAVEGDSVAVLNLAQIVNRVFEDKVTLFSKYPFSVNLRTEGGISMARYSYSLDSIANIYTPSGIKIGEDETSLPTRDPQYIGSAYVAFVGDNAHFGMTSPLMGNRYRIQAQRYFSNLNLWSFSGDYRKYWFAHPVGFALRGMFIGRYGDDTDLLYPLFLGNNYFVRGYTVRSFQKNQCQDGDCLNINQLVGSKIGVANAEIRYPLSGPERLALVKSGFLFTDLVLFTDAGIAWDDPRNLELSWDPAKNDKRIPVISSGVALRLNLFGYFVLEPYMAFPFQRKNIDTVFNLFISVGGW